MSLEKEGKALKEAIARESLKYTSGGTFAVNSHVE